MLYELKSTPGAKCTAMEIQNSLICKTHEFIRLVGLININRDTVIGATSSLFVYRQTRQGILKICKENAVLAASE